jgi:prepilin-type N-terminal cleavage/methylation domain-containing protein
MKRIRNRKINGFSLIEMMLVIAIMASLIIIASLYTQQYLDRKRVERAGMDMKQFLNASMLYYDGNGSWPEDLTLDITGTYLPAEVTPNNPWQTEKNHSEKYQYQIDKDFICQRKEGDPNMCFTLKTHTVTNSQAIKLAGLLPNGTVDNKDSTLVRSTITPDALNDSNYFKAYQINPGGKVLKPTCGAIKPEPKIFVSPAAFQGKDGKPLTGFYVETKDTTMNSKDAWQVNVKVGTAGEEYLEENPTTCSDESQETGTCYRLTVFTYCTDADDEN